MEMTCPRGDSLGVQPPTAEPWDPARHRSCPSSALGCLSTLGHHHGVRKVCAQSTLGVKSKGRKERRAGGKEITDVVAPGVPCLGHSHVHLAVLAAQILGELLRDRARCCG